ncbi:MAG: hypothetical protein WC661_20460 [Opitutaceae bacterium]|jgi:hypothetical protein
MNTKTTLNRPKRPALLTCLPALFTMTAVLHAATVFEDSFARTGPLYGSSPSPTNTTSSTWGDNATNDGPIVKNSALVIPNTNDFVFLPFDFAALKPNSVVTLSAEITLSSGTGLAWIGFGFANSNNAFGTATSWLRITTNGITKCIAGPGHTNYIPGAAFPLNAPVVVKITYDPAANQTTFYFNEKQAGTITNLQSPAMDRIFINMVIAEGDTISGTIKKLKLHVSGGDGKTDAR